MNLQIDFKKALPLLVLIFILSIPLSKAWWNSSWSYRRNITINNTQNSNTLTDYQKKIILNSSNIDWSKVNDDLSDLRFTYYNSTDNTETEIPYWIESINETSETSYTKLSGMKGESGLEGEFQLVDINGDGVKDIIVPQLGNTDLYGSEGYGGVWVYLSNGSYSWESPIRVLVANEGMYRQGSDDSAVADLNGDGNLDIVGGMEVAHVSIGYWNGSSFNETYNLIDVGSNYECDYVKVESDKDIVTDCEICGSQIGIFKYERNDSATSGYNSPVSLFTSTSYTQTGEIELYDLNDDGIEDIIAYEGEEYTKPAYLVVLVSSSETSYTSHIIEVPLNFSSRPVLELGDTNGDGKKDILIAGRNETTLGIFGVLTYNSSESDYFNDFEVKHVFNFQAYGLSAEDVDNDGSLDLIVTEGKFLESATSPYEVWIDYNITNGFSFTELFSHTISDKLNLVKSMDENHYIGALYDDSVYMFTPENQSQSRIWVKVPEIPANDYTTVYMYYGNTTPVSSESDGQSVFIDFDDFESGSLNTSKWSDNNGAATIETGCLKITDSNGAWKVVGGKTNVSRPFIEEFNWKSHDSYGEGTTGREFQFLHDDYTVTNSAGNGLGYDWYKGINERRNKDGSYSSTTNGQNWNLETWYNDTQIIVTDSTIKLYINDNLVDEWSDTTYTSGYTLFLAIRGDLLIDNYRVRKYTDPEPTYEIGSEETANQPPSVDTPKTYDENYVEQTTFGSGDKVVIRVNVSDSDGANDIDKVLIEIIDNSSVVKISNETMVNVSSITDGYTYEYNYTLPVSPSGVWTINIYANDTKNDWGYNTTTFNLDVTSPSFTNWQQEPPDLNSSSMGKLYINVTITDDSGVNDSSVKFYHWINDTQYPNQPWKFINGTAQEFEHEHTMTNITPSIFNITLHTYAYNPSIFNVDPEIMRSATKYNYSLNSNNKALKVRFYNISTNPNTTYILKPRLYRNSGNLLIYYCNSSYTNGKVYNSNYCVPLATLTSQEEVHYYQNVYFYGDENSQLDAVKITPTGYIIFYAIVGSDWKVEYANIDSNSVETSNNGGTTWSNQDFSADTWLVQINGNGLTTVGYKVYACDIVGNCVNSTIQEDLYAIADLPPSPAPKITFPENATYSGTFNITWEFSKDPNSDPFNYSVYLYYSNGTLADVLADNNITEGTEYLEFDSTKYPNGQYYLIANATDINGNTNFYILPYYFTIISPIKVIQWVEFPWSNNTHVNITLNVWVYNNASLDISDDISVDVDENYTDYNITGGLNSGDFDLHSETKQWVRPADFDEWFNFSAVELSRGLGTSNELKFILPVDPATKVEQHNITLNQTFDIISTLNKQASTYKKIQTQIISSEIISKLLSFIRNIFQVPSLNLLLSRIQNVIRNIQSLPLILPSISTALISIKVRVINQIINISTIIKITAPVRKIFILPSPPYALFTWFTSLENLVALFIALGGISTISLYFLWNKRKELWKHPFEKYKE